MTGQPSQPMFVVNAFIDPAREASGQTWFTGNPAAICPLRSWLPTPVMQAIAAQNNLSETAFFVGSEGRYLIRWFTPIAEVELCGHATLASAAVIFDRVGDGSERLVFESRGGELVVFKQGSRLILDFPSRGMAPVLVPSAVLQAVGGRPLEQFATDNGLWILVYSNAEEIRGLTPDFATLRDYPPCVVVTAPGDSADFVSRYFAPSQGIEEDPVTGSAHCVLAPFWAARLGRKQLIGQQLSKRGGVLHCEDRGDRVWIGGEVSFYLDGTLRLPA